MAISNISLVTSESTYPIAVNSPFYIIWQATYSGQTPSSLEVEISKDGITYETGFKAIPYSDPTINTRQFMFRADVFAKGFMNEFEDEVQSEASLLFMEDFSKKLWIKAKDDTGLVTSEFIGVFIVAVSQFGENEILLNINENKEHIAASGMPCYAYIYNDDESNVITVNQGGLNYVLARNFDDDIFTNYNDAEFEILVAN